MVASFERLGQAGDQKREQQNKSLLGGSEGSVIEVKLGNERRLVWLREVKDEVVERQDLVEGWRIHFAMDDVNGDGGDGLGEKIDRIEADLDESRDWFALASAGVGTVRVYFPAVGKGERQRLEDMKLAMAIYARVSGAVLDVPQEEQLTSRLKPVADAWSKWAEQSATLICYEPGIMKVNGLTGV